MKQSKKGSDYAQYEPLGVYSLEKRTIKITATVVMVTPNNSLEKRFKLCHANELSAGVSHSIITALLKIFCSAAHIRMQFALILLAILCFEFVEFRRILLILAPIPLLHCVPVFC